MLGGEESNDYFFRRHHIIHHDGYDFFQNSKNNIQPRAITCCIKYNFVFLCDKNSR